jgi:hypothetical protein
MKKINYPSKPRSYKKKEHFSNEFYLNSRFLARQEVSPISCIGAAKRKHNLLYGLPIRIFSDLKNVATEEFRKLYVTKWIDR